jgi:hypothetical protein
MRTTEPTATPEANRPFDIEIALTRIRDAVQELPRAAMFELATEGHTSLAS